MKSTVDEVALQGIEFWSTVCDEEADLAVEAAEAEESGIPPTQNSRFYVKGAMTYIVPVLLEKLTVQVRCGHQWKVFGVMAIILWRYFIPHQIQLQIQILHLSSQLHCKYLEKVIGKAYVCTVLCLYKLY